MNSYGFQQKQESVSSDDYSTSESSSESESDEEIIVRKPIETKKSKSLKKDQEKQISKMYKYYKELKNKKTKKIEDEEDEPKVVKKSISKMYNKKLDEDEEKTTIAKKQVKPVFKKGRDAIKCTNCGTIRKHINTEEYETKGGTIRIKGNCEVCEKANSKILSTGKEQQKRMILGMMKKSGLSAQDLQ